MQTLSDSLMIIGGVVSLGMIISIIGTYMKVGEIVKLLKEINEKIGIQEINKKDE